MAPTSARRRRLGTVLLSLFLIIPAVVGAVSVATASGSRRGVILISVLWITGSLALFVMQGRFYAHYAIPLAVPAGILAGIGIERISGWIRDVRRFGRLVMIVVPLTAALSVSALASVYSTTMQLAPAVDALARVQAVSAQLRDMPAGNLLVWGKEPRLYDLSNRTPATGYIYLYPLTTPGYTTEAMIERVAQGLAANPPAVVVDAGSDSPGAPGFLPLLIPRPVLTDGRNLDLLDPLRAFVAANYRLAATVDGWPVYVRNDAAVAWLK